MRIDAHQHYWQLRRGDYGWLTAKDGLLYQDYLPNQLVPLLKQHNLVKSIVIQAAPTLEETQFLLGLCHKEASLAGVVGWLDLESEHFDRQLSQLRLNPYFLGLRPTFRSNDKKELIINKTIWQSLELLSKQEVPIDLLIEPQQLAQITDVIEQIPKLRVVLNHLGNPYIGEGVLDPWQNEIERFSKLDNSFCKLSGMVTRLGKKQDIAVRIKPYVQHVINSFGAERLMYGSDWPVCLLACSYEETINALTEALPNLSINQLNQVFGSNAERYYTL